MRLKIETISWEIVKAAGMRVSKNSVSSQLWTNESRVLKEDSFSLLWCIYRNILLERPAGRQCFVFGNECPGAFSGRGTTKESLAARVDIRDMTVKERLECHVLFVGRSANLAPLHMLDTSGCIRELADLAVFLWDLLPTPPVVVPTRKFDINNLVLARLIQPLK